MASPKELRLAEQEKLKLTTVQQNKIKKLYTALSKQAAAQASLLPRDGLVSEAIRKGYLNKMAKDLVKEADRITAEVGKTTLEAVQAASELPVKGMAEFMTRMGLDIKGAFSYIPTDIVERLITGQVYGDDWNFSRALWQSGKKVQADIYEVVARGVAANKPTFDVAKDLEKYLNPSSLKPWDWNKVYPNVNSKVDYSAQRLARTLIQHSYQLSLKETVKHNPFVESIIWHSTFAHGRTCSICKERDGEAYDKAKLPLDHPNGLCYFTAEVGKLEDIGARIGDWYKGKPDPDLDNYAVKALGGTFTSKAIKNSTNPASTLVTYNYKAAVRAYKQFDSYKPVGFNPTAAQGTTVYTQEAFDKNIKTLGNLIDKQFETGKLTINVTEESLNQIIDSGVYKSSLDWTSRGADYTKYRLEAENMMFGIPETAKAVERPVYSYIDSGQKIRGDYGDIKLRLKQSSLEDRMTFTAGDSLESRVKPFIKGESLEAENFTWDVPYIATNNKKFMNSIEYIEGQIHGGITLNDIEAIEIPKKASTELEELLKSKGFEVVRGK